MRRRFLHWPLDPSVVAPHLPPGTRPDLHDGRCYAGVVGLRIARTAPGRGPSLPYLGTFDQVNVRLYSLDDEGRSAVVFQRMDAARLVPALAARAALRLPYVWSPTRVRRDGNRYEVTGGDCTPGSPAGPSTCRWRTRRGRCTARSSPLWTATRSPPPGSRG